MFHCLESLKSSAPLLPSPPPISPFVKLHYYLTKQKDQNGLRFLNFKKNEKRKRTANEKKIKVARKTKIKTHVVQ